MSGTIFSLDQEKNISHDKSHKKNKNPRIIIPEHCNEAVHTENSPSTDTQVRADMVPLTVRNLIMHCEGHLHKKRPQVSNTTIKTCIYNDKGQPTIGGP
jgi:hypothetical protein